MGSNIVTRSLKTKMHRGRPATAPPFRPVLLQKWLNLSFLHWEVDPNVAQSLLPTGLTIDTFESSTYIGLVPFTMRDIRPLWFPSVPGLSHFHETNVRLYVVGPDGRPGVWFLSLDAANRLGAWLGRNWFRLNYQFAEMAIEGTEYKSHRGDARSHVHCEPFGPEFLAEPGSLEEFLVERYSLFTVRRGNLLRGDVWHDPYRLRRAKLVAHDAGLCDAAGLPVAGDPVSVLWSPGVETKVFALRLA